MSNLNLSHFETIPVCQRVATLAYIAWLAETLPEVYGQANPRKPQSNVFREFSFYLDKRWFYDMARGKKADANKRQTDRNLPIDWCNAKIDDDVTPIILERSEQWDENLGDLFSLFVAGYDVYIKRRDGNQTVQVTIIGANPDNLERNVGLSAYAPDIQTAVAALLFKYFDVCDEHPERSLSSGSSSIG